MVYPIFGKTILPIFRSFIREVKGLDNLPKSGGFILAPNHVGFVDYFFLGSVVIPYLNRKVHFISRKEKWWELFGKGVSDWLGRIEVDPFHKQACLDQAAEVLKKGGMVGIYPEGKASKGKRLNKGKSGAIRLSLTSGRPIIPVGIIAPIGYSSLTKSIQSLLTNYGKVKLHFGQPIYYKDTKNVTKKRLVKETRQLMQEIAKLSEKYYPF